MAINNHKMIRQISGPVDSGFAVVPSDTDDLTFQTRGLYVGVAGDVKVALAQDNSVVTLKGLSAGVVHPIAVARVYATGTTATSIVGLY